MVVGRIRRRSSSAADARTGRGSPPEGASLAGSVVPFDYAARFELRGTPGNIVQDVINVSPDGVFVATAISYGFEPERAASDLRLQFDQRPQGPILPGDIALASIPAGALIEGFRVNPSFDHLVFPPIQAAQGGPAAPPDFSSDPRQAVPGDFSGVLFQKLRPSPPLSFLFNFVDSGTGREMQDVPVHNIASLGTDTGERPFRQLAKPVSFLPRSNLRLQIIEQSINAAGTLFVVLSGFKILGAHSMSEAEARALAARATVPGRAIPAGRVVPFDYVTTFELTGRPGNELSDEVVVNVEGGYMATAIGYGVALPDTKVELRNPAVDAQTKTINLASQKLRVFSPDVLRDGVRIRPSMLRLAFQSSSALNSSLPEELAGQVFERMNRAEDVQFRYSIHDSARGRDLQNQPIHNIAGLGIADGSRPFRTLVRPLHAVPRSTLRVTVEERNGRGRLYIVFQGYKVLGSRG